MQFWSKVSTLMRQLSSVDRQFVENVWLAFPKIAGQLRFDIQNAISSVSPDHIPIYDIRYWLKYESPWSLSSDVYSIPKLQNKIFSTAPIIFNEGTDYDIINNTIVWSVKGPIDWDMEANNITSWTKIGAPSVFAKDTSAPYAGSRCFKLGGDANHGIKSTNISVTADDYVRFAVQAKSDVSYSIEIWDESNNAQIGILSGLSGSSYVERELIKKIPSGCSSVTLRAYLGATGTLYLDDMKLTRYPEDGIAFAEQTLKYNKYLDTKLGYDLRFLGINSSGYTPEHAHHIIRALNFAYRSSDAMKHALEAGITAILGLPFAYVKGVIKSKTTSGSNHVIVITDGLGRDHSIKVSSSIGSLSDFVSVGESVNAFQPLIPDALKFKEVGGRAFLPETDLSYPTDGDMEAAGVTNWTAIAGSTLSKDTVNQYAGTKCLKVVAPSAGDGVKPATNKSVTAGKKYAFSFFIKRDSGGTGIIKAAIIDVTNSNTIKSEWFGDEKYEEGYMEFTAPAGCLNTRIEFTALKPGDFFMDNIKFVNLEEIKSYRADKTSDSVRASYTISATARAGTKDLVFKAAEHIYGSKGNYIDIVISASGANQELSSSITGKGTSASHYIYTITTGNANAGQNSNNAIRDFVNSDSNARGIVVCESADDSTADPTFSLTKTSLSGGTDAKISVYETIPMAVGDIISVRNLDRGTSETRKITAIANGSSPYTKVLSLSDDLYETYESPETGTSTAVGAGTLTDANKTWATNEHQGDILVDSANNSFPINSNTGTVLSVTGNPAAGAYRILKDMVAISYGQLNSKYVKEVRVYNRWTTSYSQTNMSNFVESATDTGVKFTFVNVGS